MSILPLGLRNTHTINGATIEGHARATLEVERVSVGEVVEEEDAVELVEG